MYGTVAKIRVKSGGLKALTEWFSERMEQPPGAIAIYIYQMDSDSNEGYMVVAFESKEAYVANAQSLEQHERYLEMMRWLEGEPEWHDGEIVFHGQY